MIPVAIKLMTSAVFGVVATITSAWVPAVRPLELYTNGRLPSWGCIDAIVVPPDNTMLHIHTIEGVGWLRVCTRYHMQMPTEFSADRFNTRFDFTNRRFQHWRRLNHERPRYLAKVRDGLWQNAFGWPKLAMGYDMRFRGISRTTGVRVVNGLRLTDDVSSWWDPQSSNAFALPLRPLWGGFLLDTSLYGTACFGVLFGPGILRRTVRRSRGACPRCGYRLLGIPTHGCPECGWDRL